MWLIIGAWYQTWSIWAMNAWWYYRVIICLINGSIALVIHGSIASKNRVDWWKCGWYHWCGWWMMRFYHVLCSSIHLSTLWRYDYRCFYIHKYRYIHVFVLHIHRSFRARTWSMYSIQLWCSCGTCLVVWIVTSAGEPCHSASHPLGTAISIVSCDSDCWCEPWGLPLAYTFYCSAHPEFCFPI